MEKRDLHQNCVSFREKRRFKSFLAFLLSKFFVTFFLQHFFYIDSAKILNSNRFQSQLLSIQFFSGKAWFLRIARYRNVQFVLEKMMRHLEFCEEKSHFPPKVLIESKVLKTGTNIQKLWHPSQKVMFILQVNT